MRCGVIVSVAAFLSALTVGASPLRSHPHAQDSASPQSQEVSKKASGQESQGADSSPEERKKTKKVWTNDNMSEVSASAVSQIGTEKDRSAGKSTAVKPASSPVVASFRKQLAALQTQMSNLEKQIADLKSFSKGEAPGANGLQLHKSYSTEPVDDQVRKLEEKRKQLAIQTDTLFDAARKLGIEPGQLR